MELSKIETDPASLNSSWSNLGEFQNISEPPGNHTFQSESQKPPFNLENHPVERSITNTDGISSSLLGFLSQGPDNSGIDGEFNDRNPFDHASSVAANGLYMLSQSSHQETPNKLMNNGMDPVSGGLDLTSADRVGLLPSSPSMEEPCNVNNEKMSTRLKATMKVDGTENEDNLKPEKQTGSSRSNSNSKKNETDDEKRRNFLERNRQAALKCRQRKKQWLSNLQAKVDFYGSENDALSAQISQMREEIVNLKTILLAHKDCSVARANGGLGVRLTNLSSSSAGPDFSQPPLPQHQAAQQPRSHSRQGIDIIQY